MPSCNPKGNETVPIQLAQCWLPGLAISSAKISIDFSNKIHVSNFIKQSWFEISRMLIAVFKTY